MSFLNYLAGEWREVLGLTVDHAIVVLGSVAIAAVIGVAIGVLTYRRERPRTIALAVAGVFLTIPSFALFGVLIGPLGLGSRPAVVALVMYSLLPILRNTITGLREVDPAIVESAEGMGMGRWQRLARIELPLAWPVIITGLRVATMLCLGIAAIAAYVRGPGLGNLIFTGLARVGVPVAVDLVLAGTVGIIVLAIVLDAGFTLFGKLTTPRGTRG